MIRFGCPSCQAPLAAPEERVGAQTTCPRCRQPVRVPAEAQPAPASVASAPPAPMAEQRPSTRWRRFLTEAVEVPRTTAIHSGRFLAYAGGAIRGAWLRRHVDRAQIALGDRLFQSGSGDPGLREQIRTLDGQPRRAKRRRRALLRELAAPAVSANTAPADTANEWQRLQQTRASLAAHQAKMRQARSALAPTGTASWLRLAGGCGLAACVLLLLTLTLSGRGSVGSPANPNGERVEADAEVARVTGPSSQPSAVPAKPILVLDSTGHSEIVKQAFLSPDGQRAITVAMDKTVRIWDVASGETLRVIRPPVGRGVRGVLRAGALSPDGNLLAVSGQRADPSLGVGPVYVINLAAGRVDHVLKPGKEVNYLKFSPDGRRLAAAAMDKIVLYDTGTWQPERVFEGSKGLVTGLALSADGKYLLSASEESEPRLWSLTGDKRVWTLPGATDANDATYCVAFSPDNSLFATGDPRVIRVFAPPRDNTANVIQPFATFPGSPTEPFVVGSLTFTPNSKTLLATGVSVRTSRGIAVMVDARSGTVHSTFLHSNTVQSGSLSKDGRLAITTGGNSHETFVWYCADGSLVQKFEGKGKGLWAAGWSADGKSVAWGTNNREQRDPLTGQLFCPLEYTFRLDELDVGDPPDGSYRRGLRSDNEFSVEVIRPARQHFVIREKGTPIRLHDTKGPTIEACIVLPGGRALVGTSIDLYQLDLRTGQPVRKYHGHTANINDLVPSPDGRYFLSVSSDQTLRIWDFNQEEPLLSLFVSGNEWIAWTQQGYYAASAGGERLMGWHINNGLEALASFHPAAQFRKSLYQPEVIRRVVPAGSVASALQQLGKKAEDISQFMPPTVAITSPSGLGNNAVSQSFEVRATAHSVGQHPVTSLRLLVDGRPYRGTAGVRRVPQPQLGEVQAAWRVELPPGLHVLAVQADSAVSRSVSPVVEVTAGSAAGEQSALYVLAVGINAYDGDLALHYAVQDADLFTKTVQEKGAGAFRSIEVKLIRDREATRDAIEKGLSWLRSKMTARDVGVLTTATATRMAIFTWFRLMWTRATWLAAVCPETPSRRRWPICPAG